MAYPFAPISVTTATVTLNEETHGNGVLTVLNRAGGIAVTLPASTGSGTWFRVLVGTTFTGAATIKVANSTDVMQGALDTRIATGAAGASFGEAATGTDDTISMNGTTTGGIAGSYVEFHDYAAGFWRIEGDLIGSGSITTSLSATV